MAHPMIAEHGTQVFHEAGVGRKVTAFTLLKSLCTEDHVLFLSEFIKKLLITRQDDDSGNYPFFSRLILDIKTGNAETGLIFPGRPLVLLRNSCTLHVKIRGKLSN
jgi:hypothetical protein